MSRARIFALTLLLPGIAACGSDTSTGPAAPASARIHDKLLFDSQRDDLNGDIYSINLDGSSLQRIASSPFVDICPSVSPDGTEIAFFSSRSGGQLGLHIMAADGTDVRFVDGPVYSGQCPAWSPDGTTISYFRYEAAGAATITSLRVAARNGSDLRTLTSTDYNYYAAWSPDSRTLAFLRHGPPTDSTKAGIFLIAADGSNLNRIGNNDGNSASISSISWSSDGTLLVTSCSDFVTGKIGLCERSPNGTVVKSIFPSTGAYTPVAWSPVEKVILVSGFNFPTAPLATMSADGTGLVALLPGAFATSSLAGAKWSPDGKMVAVWTYFVGSTEIVVVNKDGTGAHQITNNSSSENNISWAPLGG